MFKSLFRSYKPTDRDRTEARGLVATHGLEAIDRVRARLEKSERGSRNEAHWRRVGQAVEELLAEQAGDPQ